MVQKCCQRGHTGIYSGPHLPPLTTKVSQVEMEAARLRGSFCLRFFLPEVGGQRSEVRDQQLLLVDLSFNHLTTIFKYGHQLTSDI